MTKEMKRPISNITQDSIKPLLSNAVEFYTNKNREAHKCIQERDEYINYLESKLSNAKPQQALPVVPEEVDKAIKYLKTRNNFAAITDLKRLDIILTEKGSWWLNDFQFKDRRFGFGGLNKKLFILSHLAITGYTVEKPQLFYLKNKLTGLWLMQYEVVDKEYPYDHTSDIRNRDTFTQEEIDSMETGSYELVPVEEEK